MSEIERRAETDGRRLGSSTTTSPTSSTSSMPRCGSVTAPRRWSSPSRHLRTIATPGGRVEALTLLGRALEAAPAAPVGVRARAYNGLCIDYHALGEFESARESAAEARRLAVEAGESETELRALGNLGATSIELEDFDAAAGYLELTIELARKRGDETELARASYNLGEMTIYRDPAGAIEPLEAALEIVQRQGPQVGQILCLGRLGDARWLLGQPSEACRLLTTSLRLAAESHHSFFAPEILEALAGVAAAFGELDVGRAFAATAASLREEHGSGLSDRARARLHETYAALGIAAPSSGDAPSLEHCIDLAEALTREIAAGPAPPARAHDGPVG